MFLIARKYVELPIDLVKPNKVKKEFDASIKFLLVIYFKNSGVWSLSKYKISG